MCLSGFPDSCRLDRCPKLTALKPPVAFVCYECGELVQIDELKEADCYETPDKKKICSACMDTMTIHDALLFLGCLIVWE